MGVWGGACVGICVCKGDKCPLRWTQVTGIDRTDDCRELLPQQQPHAARPSLPPHLPPPPAAASLPFAAAPPPPPPPLNHIGKGDEAARDALRGVYCAHLHPNYPLPTRIQHPAPLCPPPPTHTHGPAGVGPPVGRARGGGAWSGHGLGAAAAVLYGGGQGRKARGRRGGRGGGHAQVWLGRGGWEGGKRQGRARGQAKGRACGGGGGGRGRQEAGAARQRHIPAPNRAVHPAPDW